MRTNKVLAAVLAIMLAITPVAALAEEFSQGSFTLQLSDPVFHITQGDETIQQDLTGLGVQLGGVLDAASEQAPSGLISLMLLADGDPAASAMIGLSGEQVYALVSDISNVLTGTPQDWQKLLGDDFSIDLSDEALAAPLDTFSQAQDVASQLQFTEGLAESVEFYSGSGEYPRFSASLTNAQLKQMMGDSASSMNDAMTLDISFFADGGENLRIEGTLRDCIDGAPEGERDLNFVVVAEIKDDGTVNIGGYLGNNNVEIDLDFNGAKDATYPEHYAFAGQVDVIGPGSSIQVQLTLSPGEAEDGAVADVLSITVFDGEEVAGALNFVCSVTDTAESYWLTLSDAPGDNVFNLGYDGAIETDATGRTHGGVLQYEAKLDGQESSGRLNISLNLSTDIQGKLPEIASMASINVADISDEQMEQLTTEAQTLLISALGKLMAVPSIATLISDAMQSGALNF